MQFALNIFILEITPPWKNWQLPGGFENYDDDDDDDGDDGGDDDDDDDDFL